MEAILWTAQLMESNKGNKEIQKSLEIENKVRKENNMPTIEDELMQYIIAEGIESQKLKEENQQKPKAENMVLNSEKRIKEKSSKSTNKIDFEVYALGTHLGVAYIERGTRSFVSLARLMLQTFGEKIRPYLKSIYNSAREFILLVDKGLADSMDNYTKVAELDIDNIVTEDMNLELSEYDIINCSNEIKANACLYIEGYVTNKTKESYNLIFDYIRNSSRGSAHDTSKAY